jgi:nucleoside recognition membrane protein YjiH
MYKHIKKTRLEKSKQPILWVRRKVILIITAFMIGMSNGLNVEDKMINENQNHTEQQHKKD